MDKGMWCFDGRSYRFVPEEGARDWYMDGMEICNQRTGDLRQSYGLRIKVKPQQKAMISRAEGTGIMNREQLNEEMIVHPVLEITVPEGENEIILPFRKFQYRQGFQLFWGFFKEFTFTTELEITAVEIIDGDPLRLRFPSVLSTARREVRLTIQSGSRTAVIERFVSVLIRRFLVGKHARSAAVKHISA